MKYVVCFDISDDKKRRMIGDILSEFGVRVQRSVFEIEINKTSFKKLLIKLQKYIDKDDSIRFYAMHNNTIKKSIYLGFGAFPFDGEDVYYF